MKQMKGFVVMVLILALMAGLAACGGSSEPAKESEAASSAAAEESGKETGEESVTVLEAESEEEKASEEASSEESAGEEASAESASSEETGAEEPQPTPESGETAAADENPVGEYTAFAIGYTDMYCDIAEMEGSGSMLLAEDGTGVLVFNGDEGTIENWTYADGTLTLAVDGDAAAATYDNGVVCIDLLGDGSVSLVLAKEGADRSGIELLPLEEIQARMEEGENPGSRTYAVYTAIDGKAGAHFSYDIETPSLSAKSTTEMHTKDDMYYSRRTTSVSVGETTMITAIMDGKVYNLYPDKMTGLFVMDAAGMLDDYIRMDDFYRLLSECAERADYTEETREKDGRTYAAEVYPETEYTRETAIYYDADGIPVYAAASAKTTAAGTELPEQFFTIHVMDENVDTSLFDISGYTIEE